MKAVVMLIEVPEMGGIHDYFIDQDICFTLWHCKDQYVLFFENECAFLEVPCYGHKETKGHDTERNKYTAHCIRVNKAQQQETID